MIRTETRGVALALALAALIISCTSDDGAADAPAGGATYFVGDVDGTSARVGVAVASGRVSFFLCGGADDTSDTAWASGTIDASGALHLEPGTLSVDAARTDDVIEGTLTRAHGTSRFRVIRVGEEPAGLWEAHEPDGRVGLVVSTPGDNGEAQGVFLTVGTTFQVTPVAPLRPVAGALRVRVPALDRTVSLARAIP
jgi:hypothetical protein